MARSRNDICGKSLSVIWNVEWCITILLWRIYIASDNKTYLDLHVKCAFTFVQFWVSWTDFKSPVSNFTEILSVGVAVIHVDRRADVTRLVSLVLFATMRTRRQPFWNLHRRIRHNSAA